jgi:hypothetical protein
MPKNGPARGERRSLISLVAGGRWMLNKLKVLSEKGLSSDVWYETRSPGTREGTTPSASRLKFNLPNSALPVSTYGAAHWIFLEL